jgi:hypothetical protein
MRLAMIAWEKNPLKHGLKVIIYKKGVAELAHVLGAPINNRDNVLVWVALDTVTPLLPVGCHYQ